MANAHTTWRNEQTCAATYVQPALVIVLEYAQACTASAYLRRNSSAVVYIQSAC